MTRRVFFSFHYDRDSWRVAIVRNSNVVSSYDKNPFFDKAKWEEIKNNNRLSTQNWIDQQLKGTSVTIVLLGLETAARPWVKYEVAKSVADGKGLLAIDITKIKDSKGRTEAQSPNNLLPAGYPLYLWNKDEGNHNLGDWIEKAARAAGR